MENESKYPWYFLLLVALALIFIICGILIVFSHPKDSIFDSTLIGACFSLSGVFVFAAALVYQIKEYKIQVDELKASVKAQTDTSITLERQKQIMMEQNSHNYIFNLIDNFNRFRARGEINETIKYLSTFPPINAANDCIYYFLADYNYSVGDTEESVFHTNFASALLHAFENYVLNFTHKSYLYDYIIFAFNIINQIENEISSYPKIDDENEVKSNFFIILFYNQLTKDEKLVLNLFNSTNHEFLKSNIHIKWHIDDVSFLIDMLKETAYNKAISSVSKVKLVNSLSELQMARIAEGS